MTLEINKGEMLSKIIPFPGSRIASSGSRIESNDLAGAMGPIEMEMRAKLSKLKGTRYPDFFDWSVYDRIADKFDSPPRGGVVFNTTFKLVNHHSSCSKCHYAFEIDTYGRGCFHDCAYCYAKDQLTSHGYWNSPQPFPVNLAEVRKVFYTVFETDRRSKWRDILEKKIPLRVGSMSDSFMWIDTKYGVTKELLKIFDFYNYPHVIFTRSDLVAHDDYLKLLRKDLAAIQFSIIGNNQAFIRQIEPGAPSYERRLKALRKLNNAGFWATVRINPLFPKHPDGYFSDPESVKLRFGSKSSAPVMPFYDNNFVAELADAGVRSILAGFVRINGKAVNHISRISGIDFKSFFKPGLAPTSGNGDGYYSNSEILEYYSQFHTIAKAQQVRFSTCYIGNGLKDYFNYQTLWSNKIDCCDVVGNVKSFGISSQDIPWDKRISYASDKNAASMTRIAEQQADLDWKQSGHIKAGKLDKPSQH